MGSSLRILHPAPTPTNPRGEPKDSGAGLKIQTWWLMKLGEKTYRVLYQDLRVSLTETRTNADRQ